MALAASVRVTMATYSTVSAGGYHQPQPRSSQGIPPLPCVTLTYHTKVFRGVTAYVESPCFRL